MSIPLPSRPGAPADAVNAIRLLLKAERTLRIYPLHNDISQRVLDELVPAMLRAVPLELELAPEQFLLGGAPLLDPEHDRATLVSALWRDGVRRIELGAALDADETRRLAVALAAPVNPDSLSDDYVTVLWGAELPHARVVAIDPYLVTDVEEEVLEGRAEQPAEPPPPSLVEGELSLPAPPEEAFLISDDDRQRVSAEIERESSSPPWASFIDALAEALGSPVAAQRGSELVQGVEAALQRLITDLRVDLALRLVRRIRDANLPPVAQEQLEGAWTRAMGRGRLASLHAALEAGELTTKPVAELLLCFRQHVVGAACSLLGQARTEAARRLYTDVLVEIGRPAVAPAIERFRSGESQGRLALARLLGRLRDPAATAPLVEALPEAGPVLRHTLLAALSGIRDEHALTVLLDVALQDSDAISRKIALRGLGAARTQLDPARLLERIRSSVLFTLDDEEKDLLFLALAGIGRDEAVPFLRGLLAPALLPWLRSRHDRRRAVDALARLSSPAARAALERYSRSWRPSVARMCAAALEKATVP